MVSNQDREVFKKLGISSILDLALIIPTSYENLTIAKTLNYGTLALLDVTIQECTTTHILKIKLFAHDLDTYIQGIIFHPKYFHTKMFRVGQRYLLYGKVEQNYGVVQLIQPKVVAKERGLIPKYKTPLQNKTLLSLVKRYVTKQNLEALGVKSEIAEDIINIHNPTMEFFLNYIKNSGFIGSHLKSIKYTEIYNHILKLSKLKTITKSLEILDSDITSFIDSLPFKLTGDQKNVIKDVQNDLKQTISARRIIMGDVGSGKTMIILASVVIAYPHRSILLAPTTILARQIYDEAKKFLPSNIKVAFVSNKSKEENLQEYDFIIGTHALLYKELPVTPLIMIDEQHRFGTKQREAIKQLVNQGDKQPHFLQFSATPIPRTMAMIQSSYIDISTIKELPFKKDIDTKIIYPKDFTLITEHIKSESRENRQTIIVYPLVEGSEVIDYQSIDEARGYWEKNFDDVYVTFGKDKNKEIVLEEFKNNGLVLLATTLIEVGISLPRLSTIIIVAPERLGLATLHQLRGRVSRNGLKGYCYLFTKKEPTKRIVEFCKTLDGFKIAQLDLNLRESGDLLKGEKQSGKEFNYFSMSDDEDILLEVKEDFR
ncbi:MAG TPA: ATP-dependent DNA helicase RecG [Campylobacterales bacterium]|nr:ATP-dependent DNA helicase RecG [Campylobacterales bacterium]